MDSDLHQITDADGNWNPFEKPIVIGDHVWIGSNVTISKGVSIGDGAVIATGSLVTKDVAARTLAGGIPARRIRDNIDWK
jgi:acetyltransferase-like isoleucine patch superfamily enzyme